MPQRARYYGKVPLSLPVVTTIPSGAIILIDPATPAPTDWADYLAPDGYYIIGSGGTAQPGDSGDPGSDPIALASDGLHAEGVMYSWFTDRTTGSGKVTVAATNVAEGLHSHTMTLKSNPDASNVKLIQATQDTGIPTGGIVLSNGLVIGMDEATELNGGILRADSSKAYGFETRGVLAESSVDTMAHDHRSHATNDGFSCSTPYNGTATTSFPHTHTIEVSGTARRLLLAAFKAASDLASVTGEIIVLYPAGTVPAGWALCDGTLGTPDTRDEIIEFASSQVGSVQGDNQFNFDGGLTSEHFHTHDTAATNQVAACPLFHTSLVGHTHIADSWSGSLIPKYFALQFIKYTG